MRRTPATVHRSIWAFGVSVLYVLLLSAALLHPVGYRVAIGVPGDAYAVASFHRPEGAYRWSAPGAAVLVPARYDGPLYVELRLHAGPGEPTLRVLRDGATVAAMSTTPEWRVYRMLLPPDATPEDSRARVEPLSLDAPSGYAPGDARPLGVALAETAVGPMDGEQPLAPTVARAVALSWGLALTWAAIALVAGWRQRMAVVAPMAGLGLGLAAWAWQAPLGFAWSLPTPPWWLLGVGTIALGFGSLQAVQRPWPGLGRGVAPGVLLLTALSLALPPPWSGGAALGLILLPGALAAWMLFPDQRSLAARAFLGACGAVTGASLVMLALDALPGAPPGWLLITLLAILSLVLVARNRRTDHESMAGARAEEDLVLSGGAPWAGVLRLALLAGAGLRLWALGSAEFQGDEARAMLLALGAAQGEDGLLLTHTKGPVEALLPATVITATDAVTEWAARLPFALASLGVVAGALELARSFAELRPAGKDEGEAAALAHPAPLIVVGLLAVDGFAVAFGRIVQYQSVVMLMMLGAFWACWRFYAGAERPRRHLATAAVLLAVGLLAHYDAAFVAPALAWLVVAGGLRRGWRPAEWARSLWLPFTLGAALLASFYVPYVASASFAETAAYLAGRAAQGDAGGPPFNNLPLYVAILAFYNAPPLAPVLITMVIAGLASLLIRYGKPRALGLALGVILPAAALVQWLAPGAYTLAGGASWALAAFGLPLLGLCALPGMPGHIRATAIWFTAALCGQAFLIAEPRTHFYTAHVPAALLVGLAVAALPRRAGGLIVAPLTALLLLGGGAYGTLVFVRQLPEYQRQYPAARPDWLRGAYGDTLPEAGYFGFPHRDGWKAAAELVRAGELAGSYGSNQNRWLVGWYLGGLARACTGQPDLYLIAEGEPTVYYPPGIPISAEVTVGPGRALAIYGPEKPAGPMRSAALETYAAAFDAHPLAARDAGALLNGEPPPCR